MSALLCCAVLATSCSDDPEPVAVPQVVDEALTPVYDGTLEPAEAVMALVPEAATVLVVTDYAELRLELEQSELTSESTAKDRTRFWRVADRTAVLFSPGLLRGVDRRLRKQYGFTQDDVAWEARFGTPTGEGWVLAFRDDLDLAGVQRAVDDGVGPLAGADVDAAESLVSLGTTSDPISSWAADAARVDLVGPIASATYVDTACIPYDVAFDDGEATDLAAAPAADVEALDELGPFSVSYGTTLVTVRLGAVRNDTFDRARLPDILPRTDPEFGLGYLDPVADPSGGRIGYRLGDPDVAERLARRRHLPFAVCAS
ncbi:hypothetical protein BH09ACT12_BH09ACT12_25270 [soil metagenome]